MMGINGEHVGPLLQHCSQDYANGKHKTLRSLLYAYPLNLYFSGTQPLDMEATLTSPSGKSEACEIRDVPGHIYDIRFTPTENGIHSVSIKYKGIHITGCLR
jgi:Filamin/ABP280 repeat